MLRIEIPVSKSKNYIKVFDYILEMGGVFEKDRLILEIKEPITAYRKLFPIMKYQFLEWKGTKAYYNGKEVPPYKFILKHHLESKNDVDAIINSIK